MKTRQFVSASLMLIVSSAGICANPTGPDQKTLTAALENYLAQHGDFCLGKYDWPIDVTALDVGARTRDAVQMPALEKLGLVASSSVTVMRKTNETEESVPATRYALTDEGKRFYLKKDISLKTPDGQTIVHHGDFCAGKVSLARIVKWDKSASFAQDADVTVSYTYKFAAAEWTHAPEIQKAFPMLDRLLKGEGTLQLEQHFRLLDKNWVAVNPWE
ncbi:MAG TPA: hypothetical protein VMT94_05455 [Burkholderiales bacterium]|nr:hypothetical protein [Burkholderiales bacterium]